MNLYETTFIVLLIIYIGLLLIRVYNVMNAGKEYDIKVGIIFFISTILVYGIIMTTYMFSAENLYLLSLFRLVTWLLVPQVLLFAAEVIMEIRNQALAVVKQAHNSIEVRKNES